MPFGGGYIYAASSGVTIIATYFPPPRDDPGLADPLSFEAVPLCPVVDELAVFFCPPICARATPVKLRPSTAVMVAISKQNFVFIVFG